MKRSHSRRPSGEPRSGLRPRRRPTAAAGSVDSPFEAACDVERSVAAPVSERCAKVLSGGATGKPFILACGGELAEDETIGVGEVIENSRRNTVDFEHKSKLISKYVFIDVM